MTLVWADFYSLWPDGQPSLQFIAPRVDIGLHDYNLHLEHKGLDPGPTSGAFDLKIPPSPVYIILISPQGQMLSGIIFFCDCPWLGYGACSVVVVLTWEFPPFQRFLHFKNSVVEQFASSLGWPLEVSETIAICSHLFLYLLLASASAIAQTPGGHHLLSVISESGLYRVGPGNSRAALAEAEELSHNLTPSVL
ncbi:hypothetical protein Tco_0154499 [Tanacetum coccineum]